jgi:hypothetical protein
VRITLAISASLQTTGTDVTVDDSDTPPVIRVALGAWAGGR